MYEEEKAEEEEEEETGAGKVEHHDQEFALISTGEDVPTQLLHLHINDEQCNAWLYMEGPNQTFAHSSQC